MVAAKQIFVDTKVTTVIPVLYFTAEAANSTISMSKSGSAPTVYLETSPTGEKGSWTDFTVGTTTITLENVGDKVYFRAKQDNKRFATNSTDYNKFVMTGKIAASGNINALLKADYSVINLSTRDYCYACMFRDCAALTTAPALPATTLAVDCYRSMFNGCTSLTDAPALPATNLATGCYQYMFYGCTALTQASKLPATILAGSCYFCMFYGCTSLIQLPELPATTMISSCYSHMFKGCTQLNEITTAQTSFENCNNWLSNVSQTGTFYCPSVLGTNDTIERGVSACPDGWNVVNI